MTLYGICRELNKCVCGLCAQIQYGSNKGMAERGPEPKPGCTKCGALRLRKNHKCPVPKVAKPKSEPKLRPKSGCPNCSAQRLRKDHRCPALPPQLPKATPVVWGDEDTTPLPCGCITWAGRRIKWCYTEHTPQSHPNPEQ